jgi:hypothetical protein
MSFYDEASWVLIPEGIKEYVVYAQKPTNGLGDLTFTRASDATRTNSAGVIERTPWNLVQFSEQFDNAYWAKIASLSGSVAVTSNYSNSPIDTLTADRLLVNNLGVAYIAPLTPITVISGRQYTMSIYAKSNTSSSYSYRLRDGYSNTSTGDLTITPTWQRFSFTITTTSTSAELQFITTAIVASDLSIWGAQFVEGTDAKPYFATTNRQDVPRLDYRNADGTLNSCPRLLLEPQRTNSIRNSTMVGAVAGSPGTLPTNWTSSNGGLTRTVVGTGTENGVQYTDVRFNGTANSTVLNVGFDGATVIAATNGQTWTLSSYVKTTAGTLTSIRLRVIERNSVAGYLTEGSSSALTVTSSLNRLSYTRTNTNASCAFVEVSLYQILTIGETYDFTIRIAAPQMELGAYATTFIPTTTAAVTRLADAASKTGVSSLIGQTEGTLFVDMNLLVRSGNAYFALAPNLGLTSNYIGVSFSPTIIQAEMVSSSVAQAAIQFVNSATGNFKIAFAYKQNDLAFYVNGVLVGTDTNATVPVCSQIGLFNYFQTMALQYNQAALFPTRLTNAQLAQLTA